MYPCATNSARPVGAFEVMGRLLQLPDPVLAQAVKAGPSGSPAAADGDSGVCVLFVCTAANVSPIRAQTGRSERDSWSDDEADAAGTASGQGAETRRRGSFNVTLCYEPALRSVQALLGALLMHAMAVYMSTDHGKTAEARLKAAAAAAAANAASAGTNAPADPPVPIVDEADPAQWSPGSAESIAMAGDFWQWLM